MSSSITIPTRTGYGESNKAATSSSSSSSFSSPRTPQQQQQAATPTSSTSKYGHDRRRSLLSEYSVLSPSAYSVITIRVPPATMRHNTAFARLHHTHFRMADRYPGSSLSKQEHTVINIGDPDGVPRLVSLINSQRLALVQAVLTVNSTDHLR